MDGDKSPGVELTPGTRPQPKPCWGVTVPSPRVPRQTRTRDEPPSALFPGGSQGHHALGAGVLGGVELKLLLHVVGEEAPGHEVLAAQKVPGTLLGGRQGHQDIGADPTAAPGLRIPP